MTFLILIYYHSALYLGDIIFATSSLFLSSSSSHTTTPAVTVRCVCVFNSCERKMSQRSGGGGGRKEKKYHSLPLTGLLVFSSSDCRFWCFLFHTHRTISEVSGCRSHKLSYHCHQPVYIWRGVLLSLLPPLSISLSLSLPPALSLSLLLNRAPNPMGLLVYHPHPTRRVLLVLPLFLLLLRLLPLQPRPPSFSVPYHPSYSFQFCRCGAILLWWTHFPIFGLFAGGGRREDYIRVTEDLTDDGWEFFSFFLKTKQNKTKKKPLQKKKKKKERRRRRRKKTKFRKYRRTTCVI